MNPLRTLTSLKRAPAYKPLPRRQIDQSNQHFGHQSQQHNSVTQTTLDQSQSLNDQHQNGTLGTALLIQSVGEQTRKDNANSTTVKDIDDIDGDDDDDGEEEEEELDADEYVDPFQTGMMKGTRTGLGIDEYDDDDDEDDDDDDDDEEAELRRALKQIQQERQREEQLQVKEELQNNQMAIKDEIINEKLLSNPLLADKMTILVKQENSYKTEIKNEFDNNMGEELSSAPNPSKRKAWTKDGVFSNTALSVGDDNDLIKRQRLNNNTITSDKHQDFMKSLFK